jgi:hypothetical protein
MQHVILNIPRIKRRRKDLARFVGVAIIYYCTRRGRGPLATPTFGSALCASG